MYHPEKPCLAAGMKNCMLIAPLAALRLDDRAGPPVTEGVGVCAGFYIPFVRGLGLK